MHLYIFQGIYAFQTVFFCSTDHLYSWFGALRETCTPPPPPHTHTTSGQYHLILLEVDIITIVKISTVLS